MPSRTSQIAQVGKRQLELSNSTKLLFPDDHIVKAQLIEYYLKIAPTILAHVKGRPLSLVRYPDVKGLVGLWSYNGPAILNAVREAGKVGRVRIIAFDEADETLAGIKDGAIHATVVQQPYEFGYQAIKRMAQAVRGDRSFIPPTKQIIVPTLVVNRANVEEFTRRINTLRGR